MLQPQAGLSGLLLLTDRLESQLPATSPEARALLLPVRHSDPTLVYFTCRG